MSATSDEQLRTKQIRALRRQWLRDQELSPREPVEVPGSRGPVARFWQRFLTPQTAWRLYTYRSCRMIGNVVMFGLLPTWTLFYLVKYQSMNYPLAVVARRWALLPGDTIAETGEVLPDLPPTESHGESHH
uniref:NADH dehydrogenase [ubiquinone] 1 beta subcomplex subunit 6 n=1 Tax=Myxine glutinosa TaxID=7769 RepID=UPI00358F6B22